MMIRLLLVKLFKYNNAERNVNFAKKNLKKKKRFSKKITTLLNYKKFKLETKSEESYFKILMITHRKKQMIS